MLPVWESAASAAESVLEAARSVHRIEVDVVAADDRVRDSTELHQRAVDVRQRLVDQRFADMAGELSGGLVAGADCPVCGSMEHPRPAVRTAQPVDATALADAQSVEVTLAAARSAAVSRAGVLRAELAAAQALAGGSHRGGRRVRVAGGTRPAGRRPRSGAGPARPGGRVRADDRPARRTWRGPGRGGGAASRPRRDRERAGRVGDCPRRTTRRGRCTVPDDPSSVAITSQLWPRPWTTGPWPPTIWIEHGRCAAGRSRSWPRPWPRPDSRRLPMPVPLRRSTWCRPGRTRRPTTPGPPRSRPASPTQN